MADSTLLRSFRLFSRPLASLLRDIRWITPNGITVAGFIISLIGIALPVLRPASHAASITGAALIFVGIVFDTLDGDLARLRGQGSPFGAWLDGFIDRVSEVVYLLALGWGLPRYVFVTLAPPGGEITIGSRELALAALILSYFVEYSGLLWGRHAPSTTAPATPAATQPSALGQIGSWLGPGSVARQVLLVAALLVHRPLFYLPLVCAYEITILSWNLGRILRSR